MSVKYLLSLDNRGESVSNANRWRASGEPVEGVHHQLRFPHQGACGEPVEG